MALAPDQARLLAAVADELVRARAEVEAVEALVARLVRHAPAADRPAALVQAQGLDALNQNLDSLAAVLRALGQGADPDQAVDPVALADLAARLRPAGDRPPTADPGDLILF
jgi:hypothetical protein